MTEPTIEQDVETVRSVLSKASGDLGYIDAKGALDRLAAAAREGEAARFHHAAEWIRADQHEAEVASLTAERDDAMTEAREWYDTAKSLTAERDRLRKELEWIAANDVDPLDGNRRYQLGAMIRGARAALSPQEGTTP